MSNAPDVVFSQELADRICAQLADGKSLRTVCNAEGMPDKQSVFRWLRTNAEFEAQYTKAKREGADSMVDDMQDIADRDDLDPNDKRIRVDTRKWIASKMRPKVYGEKIAVSGDDEGAPLVISWQQAEKGK